MLGVSEQELRRIFCLNNGVQLAGVGEDFFQLLLSELSDGCDERGRKRVPLDALKTHSAFALRTEQARREQKEKGSHRVSERTSRHSR